MIDRRLGMDELGDAFGSEVSDALEMGRLLQASIDEAAQALPAADTGLDATTGARGGLADRVMAALADEPAPTPAGFLLPLRRRGFAAGLWTSFQQASVAARGGGRPLLARSAALAYVLVVAIAGISLTGAATIGTAGALGLLGPAATRSPIPTPPPTRPGPTIAPPSAPQPTVAPSMAPTAPAPTPSPTESDDHGGGAGATDDHGGNSGPGGGGSDNSGPGSSSSTSGSGSDGSGTDDSGSESGSSSGSGSGPGSTPRPSATSGSGSGADDSGGGTSGPG